MSDRRFSSDPEVERALDLWLTRLSEWGKRINLVGPRVLADPDPDVREALAGVGAVEPPERYADIGSGGGFPAIPLLASWRPRESVLVEPREKRATFLKLVCADIGRPVTVERRRWQDLEREGQAFDVVSARGLSAVDLEGIEALLAPNGRFLWFTSSSGDGPSGLILEKEQRLDRGGRLLVFRGDVSRGTFSPSVAE